MRKIALLFAVTSALSASAAQPNDSLKGQYYRLFTPLTFYHNVATHALSLDETDHLVKTTETDLQETGSVREDVDQPIENTLDFVEQVEAPIMEFQDEAPVEVDVQKPKFWTRKGDGFLQFMQNYVSGNWYKGGESNYSAVGALTLEASAPVPILCISTSRMKT